jgi:2-keto-myo-inositol isomerase
MEVFRPDYYKLTNEENIKQAAERTRAHVAKYWDN